MLKQFLAGTVLATVLLIYGAPAAAQDQGISGPDSASPTAAATVSSEQLEQFARAWVNIQLINQQAQQAIADVVQEQGFSADRLLAISESLENETPITPELTPEEEQSLTTLGNQISQIQAEASGLKRQAVQEEGLDIERFQEIIAALQSSPDLQAEVNGIIETLVSELQNAG